MKFSSHILLSPVGTVLKWQMAGVLGLIPRWSGICSLCSYTCCSAARELGLRAPSSLLTTQTLLQKSYFDIWKHICDNHVCQAQNYFSSIPENKTFFFIFTWSVWPPPDLSAHSPSKWQTIPSWKNDEDQTVVQPQNSRELRSLFPLSFFYHKKVLNKFTSSSLQELQPSALI